MARGEAVIAISDTVREHIRDAYPWVDPDRITVIHRGVDPLHYPYGYDPPPEWRVRWEREMTRLAGRFVLSLPARLSPRKGAEDFIALIAALKGRGVPVHGLLAGGADRPERRTALEARIAERGLEAELSLLGHRADLREVMAASNLVFCLSKAPEAFGRTTLEALSLGVPVIGYDHGGVHEILTRVFPEGRTPAGDLPALVAKTLDFILHPRTVPRLHPYTRVHPYTLGAMLDRTIELYESLHGSGAR
jgi:glycosyltransferase involved in cell wall biosynthesis